MGSLWAWEEEGPSSFQQEWRKDGDHRSRSLGIGDRPTGHLGIAIRGDPPFSPSSKKRMHQPFLNCR
jgi:hypothetical protein